MIKIFKPFCYYGFHKLCTECFKSCEYRRKDHNIKFDTERFQTLGEAIIFLKKYSKDNYKKNDGLNMISNYEIISIINFLEAFISENKGLLYKINNIIKEYEDLLLINDNPKDMRELDEFEKIYIKEFIKKLKTLQE